MKMIQIIRQTSLIAFMVMLISPAVAGPDSFKRYYFLRWNDYKKITNCSKNRPPYERSMLAALHFLVFTEPFKGKGINTKNIHYARRHTLPLFRDLRSAYANPEGFLAERCMHHSLRRIGIALQILDAKGRYPSKLSHTGTPTATNPALAGKIPAKPVAFPVMSRANYNKSTACLVSPSTYGKYRIAFEWVALRIAWHNQDIARKSMVAFLEDLFDSAHTKNGFVHQKCMIPSISRIAAYLDLLDDKGRYHSRH